jgi:hypothetical protein
LAAAVVAAIGLSGAAYFFSEVWGIATGDKKIEIAGAVVGFLLTLTKPISEAIQLFIFSTDREVQAKYDELRKALTAEIKLATLETVSQAEDFASMRAHVAEWLSRKADERSRHVYDSTLERARAHAGFFAAFEAAALSYAVKWVAFVAGMRQAYDADAIRADAKKETDRLKEESVDAVIKDIENLVGNVAAFQGELAGTLSRAAGHDSTSTDEAARSAATPP